MVSKRLREIALEICDYLPNLDDLQTKLNNWSREIEYLAIDVENSERELKQARIDFEDVIRSKLSICK